MASTTQCPKCDYTAESGFAECPRCGIIVSKFLAREQERGAFEQQAAQESHATLERLAKAGAFKIEQRKEWGEILTGFETRNKYRVTDFSNQTVFDVEEESGGIAALLARFLLTHLRPFTIRLFSPQGREIFTLQRPFRFYFHELEVRKPGGSVLGRVVRRFALLRRRYTLRDRHGREIYQLFGPIIRPWTFLIKQDGRDVGKIVKRWSGLLKESFTDADNFGLELPADLDADQKALLLGATFLIDFVHFEKNKN
jgi:uncharacterized protein YxjI